MGKSKKGPIEEIPKINCLACGNETDHDSKYCKHCGAPAKPETQKIPPHLKRKKSRKKIYAVIIFLIIVIGIISLIFIFFYEDIDEKETYIYSPEDIPSSLKIDLDMNNGSVEIKFTSDLTEPVVKLIYHKKWQGFVMRQPSFETSSSKVTFKASEVMGDADSKLTAILHSDVEYDIECKIDSGSVALNSVDQGVILGTVDFDSKSGSSSIFGTNLTIAEQIKLNSEDGSSSVFLRDCTIGDIDSTYEDGSLAINLEKCTVKDIHVSGDSGSASIRSIDSAIISNSSWTLDVDSGSVKLNIEQSTSIGADVTIDASTDGRNDIRVNYNGNSTKIRAKFTANKDIIIKENAGFEVLDSKNLESSNFSNETLDKFDIKLTADKGDLEVDVSNL